MCTEIIIHLQKWFDEVSGLYSCSFGEDDPVLVERECAGHEDWSSCKPDLNSLYYEVNIGAKMCQKLHPNLNSQKRSEVKRKEQLKCKEDNTGNSHAGCTYFEE
ncbi:hypothetical protein TNCV_2772271 [Trichonephila clavipes]|nr:hypothetical protein TNCV_2772271 [Trichonephila clavipes]